VYDLSFPGMTKSGKKASGRNPVFPEKEKSRGPRENPFGKGPGTKGRERHCPAGGNKKPLPAKTGTSGQIRKGAFPADKPKKRGRQTGTRRKLAAKGRETGMPQPAFSAAKRQVLPAMPQAGEI